MDPLVYVTIILVIVTGGMVTGTFGLIIITYLYTQHTKRMADIMLKEYELRIKPHYDIVPEIETHNREYIHGNVRIKNIGQNTIYVKNIEILLFVIGSISLTKQYDAGYEGMEVIIPPDDNSIYGFHIAKKEFATEKYIDSEPFFGVNCNVVFRAEVSGPKREYERESVTII